MNASLLPHDDENAVTAEQSNVGGTRPEQEPSAAPQSFSAREIQRAARDIGDALRLSPSTDIIPVGERLVAHLRSIGYARSFSPAATAIVKGLLEAL